MGDSDSRVFDSLIPNGIVLVLNEKLESFEIISKLTTPFNINKPVVIKSIKY